MRKSLTQSSKLLIRQKITWTTLGSGLILAAIIWSTSYSPAPVQKPYVTIERLDQQGWEYQKQSEAARTVSALQKEQADHNFRKLQSRSAGENAKIRNQRLKLHQKLEDLELKLTLHQDDPAVDLETLLRAHRQLKSEIKALPSPQSQTESE